MLEYSVFKQYVPCFEKLTQFGFVQNEGRYTFKTCFFHNQFEAVIEVFEQEAEQGAEQGTEQCPRQGIVQGKVFDLAGNEEYLPLHVENWQGTFINEVRSAYKEILLGIRDACFIKNYFIYPQSNRIARLIKEKYGDEPAFLWEKYPSYAVFKNPDTNKWYAALLNIEYSKINPAKSGEIEILDIKADPKDVQELLHQDGFYPAWHMNKQSWLTVVLDDSLSDRRIMELLAKSYAFTVKKTQKKK